MFRILPLLVSLLCSLFSFAQFLLGEFLNFLFIIIHDDFTFSHLLFQCKKKEWETNEEQIYKSQTVCLLWQREISRYINTSRGKYIWVKQRKSTIKCLRERLSWYNIWQSPPEASRSTYRVSDEILKTMRQLADVSWCWKCLQNLGTILQWILRSLLGSHNKQNSRKPTNYIWRFIRQDSR